MTIKVNSIEELFSVFGYRVPSEHKPNRKGICTLSRQDAIYYRIYPNGVIRGYTFKENHIGSRSTGGVIFKGDSVLFDSQYLEQKDKVEKNMVADDVRKDLMRITRQLHARSSFPYLKKAFLSKRYATRLSYIDLVKLRAIGEPKGRFYYGLGLVGDAIALPFYNAETGCLQSYQFINRDGVKAWYGDAESSGAIWTLEPISGERDIYIAEGMKSALGYLACKSSDARRNNDPAPSFNVGCCGGCGNAVCSIELLTEQIGKERIHYITDRDDAGCMVGGELMLRGFDVLLSPDYDTKEIKEFHRYMDSVYGADEARKPPKDYGDEWFVKSPLNRTGNRP